MPVSVSSGSFVPNSASSVMIQAYFRTEPQDSQVRLWIQGEVGGLPYLRRSEFKVSSAWELRAVRRVDLPAGGLDSARLRFEMLTPGTLWIDDVHVVGEVAPKAVRLNAQRTLLAALQAYRAQRYGEFARLAGSHWARHPGILAISRQNRPAELSATSGSSRSGPPRLLPFRLVARCGKIGPRGQEDRILARGTDHDWSSTKHYGLGPDSPRERRTG